MVVLFVHFDFALPVRFVEILVVPVVVAEAFDSVELVVGLVLGELVVNLNLDFVLLEELVSVNFGFGLVGELVAVGGNFKMLK